MISSEPNIQNISNIGSESINEISEKINKIKQNNYKSIYKENCFVDYYQKGTGWRIGKIKLLLNYKAFIEDIFIEIDSNSNIEHIELTLTNPHEISYFTKHTLNTNFQSVIKPSTTHLDEIITWFNETLFKKYNFNNKDIMTNENSYEIFCAFRGYFYYNVLIYIFPNYSNYNKKDSEKLLLCIQYTLFFISSLLKFLKENVSLLIEYENNKNQETSERILYDWKFAIVSSYKDILTLLFKIIGINNIYSSFKNSASWFNDILTNNKYKESPNVIDLFRSEQVCIDIAYKKEQFIGSSEEHISACPIARFIDYFFQLKGFYVIYEIIQTSTTTIPFSLINRLLKVFESVSRITGRFSIKGAKEIDDIKNTITNRLNNLDEKEIKETPLPQIEEVIKLISSIIPSTNNEHNQYRDSTILLYYYRCYSCNNLDSKLIGLKGFSNVINSIYKQNGKSISNTLVYSKDCNEISNFFLQNDPSLLVIFFDEKNIVDSFFEESVHEEIFKRSLRIIKLMSLNDWNMNLSETEKIKKKTLEICDLIWKKGYDTRAQKEGLSEWFKEYLCEFVNGMDYCYKLYFYEKLKEYTIKRGGIKEDFKYLLNFTLKNIEITYEEEALIMDNKKNILEDNQNEYPLEYYDYYIKKCKLFGLEMFLEIFNENNNNNKPNNKNEIQNSLEQQSSNYNKPYLILTKDQINICVELITSLLNNSKIYDRTRVIFIHKFFSYISINKASVDPVAHILLSSLFTKKSNIVIYKNILQTINKNLNIVDIIFSEFIEYIQSYISNPKITENNLYSHKENVSFRLNILNFLLNKSQELPWPENKFQTFWETTIKEPATKEEFFCMLGQEIDKINLNFKEKIYNKLLFDNTDDIINDMKSYSVFKNAICEINHNHNYFYLTPTTENNIYIKKPNKIIGIDKLWNLLLNTNIQIEIKEDISSLLCNICLNHPSFTNSNEKGLIQFWRNFIQKTITLLNEGIENKNDTIIESLLKLIKKIYQKTGEDGNISNTYSFELKNKFVPESSQKYCFKRADTNEKTYIKVYDGELFYILRNTLSNFFNIPKNKVSIEVTYKRTNYGMFSVESTSEKKLFNMNNDLDETNLLIMKPDFHEENKEQGLGFFKPSIKFTGDEIIVRTSKHPILNLSTNPKQILVEQSFDTIINKLLKESNKNYINELFDLVKQMYSTNFQEEINESLIPLLIENGNDQNNLNYIHSNYNFENLCTYFCSYKITEIKNTLFEYSKEQSFFLKSFTEGYLWINIIKPLFYRYMLIKSDNIDEVFESIHLIHNLIEIYNEVNKETETTRTTNENNIFISHLIIHLEDIMLLYSDEKNTITNNYKCTKMICNCQKFIIDILSKNNYINEIINKVGESNNDEKKVEERILNVLQNCVITCTNNILQNNYISWIYRIFNIFEDNYCSQKEKSFTHKSEFPLSKIEDLSYFIISNILSENHLLSISYKVNEIQSNFINQKLPTNTIDNIDTYFQMISNIISKTFIYLNNSEHKFDYNKFINSFLLKEISKQPSIHELIFSGYFRIIVNIVNYYSISFNKISLPENKSIDLSEYIYDYCLFSKCKPNPLTSPFPRCFQYSSSIENAFHLLTYFAYNNEELRNKIINELIEFHNKQFWKKESWSIMPTQLKRLPYVGIKNLGCTCYMNSLFQIFFSIPELREGILNCECDINPKNSLFQLKKLFYELYYSDGSSCSTEDFCQNFDNETLKTNEQMDIDEFFNTMIDKIENHLKLTSNADLIKYIFEGKISDDLIFDCGHTRSNEFSFYSSQLQVKGKNSLQESLQAIIDGETMDGANKIYCEQCNDKRTATKRQTFQTLPKIMLFVLKRFEYDYAKGVRIKVNDYYEFPIEFDMSPFISRTSNSINNEKNNNKCVYKLKGIVIHSGNSERGHYFDYIRDSKTNEWFEFNDTLVSEYDIKNIKENAFGNSEKSNKENNFEKNRNAYLLFYERKDENNIISHEINRNIKVNIKNNLFDESQIISKINSNLQQFHIQKILFSKEYQMFILEFIFNMLCTFSSELNEINLSKTLLSKVYETECKTYENIKQIVGMNINKFILNKNIYYFTNLSSKEDNLPLILKCFEFLLIYFFQVFVYSELISTYLFGYIDLFKYLINRYYECAQMLILEFSNKNVVIEYLSMNNKSCIKYIILSLIKCAMIKLKNILKEKQTRNNKISSEKLNPKNNINSIINEFISNMFYILFILSDVNQKNFIWGILYNFADINDENKSSLLNHKYINSLFFNNKNIFSKELINDHSTYFRSSNYFVPSQNLLVFNNEFASNIFNFTTSNHFILKDNFCFILFCTLLTYKTKQPNAQDNFDIDVIKSLFNHSSYSIRTQFALSEVIVTYIQKNIKASDIFISYVKNELECDGLIKEKRDFLFSIIKRTLLDFKEGKWEKRAKSLLNLIFIKEENCMEFEEFDEISMFIINLFTKNQETFRPLVYNYKNKFGIINQKYNEILSKNRGQGKGELSYEKIKEKISKIDTIINSTSNSKSKILNENNIFSFQLMINDIIVYDGKEYIIRFAQNEVIYIEEITNNDIKMKDGKLVEIDDEKILIKI